MSRSGGRSFIHSFMHPSIHPCSHSFLHPLSTHLLDVYTVQAPGDEVGLTPSLPSGSSQFDAGTPPPQSPSFKHKAEPGEQQYQGTALLSTFSFLSVMAESSP